MKFSADSRNALGYRWKWCACAYLRLLHVNVKTFAACPATISTCMKDNGSLSCTDLREEYRCNMAQLPLNQKVILLCFKQLAC